MILFFCLFVLHIRAIYELQFSLYLFIHKHWIYLTSLLSPVLVCLSESIAEVEPVASPETRLLQGSSYCPFLMGLVLYAFCFVI